jgi:hypothetical protein
MPGNTPPIIGGVVSADDDAAAAALALVDCVLALAADPLLTTLVSASTGEHKANVARPAIKHCAIVGFVIGPRIMTYFLRYMTETLDAHANVALPHTDCGLSPCIRWQACMQMYAVSPLEKLGKTL